MQFEVSLEVAVLYCARRAVATGWARLQRLVKRQSFRVRDLSVATGVPCTLPLCLFLADELDLMRRTALNCCFQVLPDSGG